MLHWPPPHALLRSSLLAGPQQTLYVPAPRLTTGVNTLVVLELGNTSSDLTTEFVGQPELQMPPPNKPGKCDPTMPPVAGALVNMVSESPKTAHQQQWTMNSDGECRSAEHGCGGGGRRSVLACFEQETRRGNMRESMVAVVVVVMATLFFLRFYLG